MIICGGGGEDEADPFSLSTMKTHFCITSFLLEFFFFIVVVVFLFWQTKRKKERTFSTDRRTIDDAFLFYGAWYVGVRYIHVRRKRQKKNNDNLPTKKDLPLLPACCLIAGKHSLRHHNHNKKEGQVKIMSADVCASCGIAEIDGVKSDMAWPMSPPRFIDDDE